MEAWPDWEGSGAELLPRQKFTAERSIAPPERGGGVGIPMPTVLDEMRRMCARHGAHFDPNIVVSQRTVMWEFIARALLLGGVRPTVSDLDRSRPAVAIRRLLTAARVGPEPDDAELVPYRRDSDG